MIDEDTWQTMQAIKDRREMDASELVGFMFREVLIEKAATEGLTPSEIQQARNLDATQRQNLNLAADLRERSED